MSRKYRQRGYQEEDRPEPRRSGGAGPRERSDKPRGRGLGAPTASLFRCARCGREQEGERVAVDALCSGCGDDLHTCTNCSFFDTSAPNECRRPVEVRIAAKSRRNECGQFAPRTVQEFERERPGGDDPRAAFDALFDL